MEDLTLDLEAADERMVLVSMQDIPNWLLNLQPAAPQTLYHPPYFPWNQLPDAHAPTMGDYLSSQFSAQTGISGQVGDIYSGVFF
ncbi:hypothetical protein N7444_006858 [Penicillium canescens]|nr:hypothetical protein N7444_006858 [Penicillium canescens]